MIIGSLLKCRGSDVYEMHGDTVAFRLCQNKIDSRLGVFALFEGSRAARTSRMSGQNLLVLLHFARRIVGAARKLIEPAELIVGGRVVWLELNDRLKLADRVGYMTQGRLGQTKLEIKRRYSGINLLGLLKSLYGLLRLIEFQVSAAHEVVGRRAVVVQSDGLLTLLYYCWQITGKQTGVGEVEPRVQVFGRRFHGLRVDAHGVGRIPFCQETVPTNH